MEAEERRAHDGQFGFLGASTRLGPVQIKAFSYLLDFSSKEQVGALATTLADTQTYGLRVISNLTIASTTRLNLTGSYARQTDFQSNPHDYGVDYLAAEATLTRGLVGATLGYELLGSDLSTTGVQRAFQTPLATLHKFNGWTDQFLATPAAGLEDWYGGLSLSLPRAGAFGQINAGITYHRFESDVGSIRYGDEWNASAGLWLGRVGILVKYADFDAKVPSFADTRKVWLQVEVSY